MRRVLTVTALLFLVAAPARADITGFIGANLTPDNRAVAGGALGFGLLIVGFEFEYAYTPDDPKASAPSLTTGSGNGLLQTPFPIFGFQPYATAGVALGDVETPGHERRVQHRGGVKIAHRSTATARGLPRVRWEAVRCIRQRTASTQD
jgi:hypothetical protein